MRWNNCFILRRRRFMLAKAPEEEEYLTILAGAVSALQPEEIDVVGGDYQVNGATVTLTPRKTQKPILPVKPGSYCRLG
jgi:hypothetical protein